MRRQCQKSYLVDLEGRGLLRSCFYVIIDNEQIYSTMCVNHALKKKKFTQNHRKTVSEIIVQSMIL